MTDSSWDSTGRAHQVMEGLVRDYGPQVLSNAQLLRNLLGDKLPTSPKESSLLVAAAEAGVAGMLRDRLGQQIPPEAAVQQTSLALQEQRGYDQVACSWVVTEFVRALGHTVDPMAATMTARPPPAVAAATRVADEAMPRAETIPGPRVEWPPAEKTIDRPDLPPARGRSGLSPAWLVVGGLVLLFVVGGIAFAAGAFKRGPTTAPKVSDATSPGASPQPSPQSELREAQGIQSVVSESAPARAGVQKAVNAISSCGDVQGAVSELQSDASTRQNLIAEVSGLQVDAIPNGQAIKSSLQQAFSASATSDQNYAAWGRDVATSGCSGSAPQDSNYAAAQQSDKQATNAKREFADRWNPVAQILGLPTQDPNQI